MKDKVVVITGASGGLGRAVAEAFAAVGAQLVLVDRHGAAAVELPEATHVAVDLLDEGAVRAEFEAVGMRLGRIDALCNLAGGFSMGPAVHETSAQDWQRMQDMNVGTLLNAVRAAVPVMLAGGGGAVVNVGAGAGEHGMAQMGAYAAAKSAVIRLTEAMSGELREQGVNVNCVLPSIIDTPANRVAMPDADPARWVAPGDLAQVIVFLCSAQARAVHGAALPVVGLS